MKMKKIVCAMVSAALLVSMAAATAFAVESVPSKTGTDADAGKTDVSVSGSASSEGLKVEVKTTEDSSKEETQLKGEGVELLYHNHNCELRHVNAEKRAYDILLEETDPQFVNFEFDSYWFTEGGANALAWMQRLGTRMKLWHINDRGTRISGSAVTPILKTDSMELGTGNMDLDSLMAQALTIGVDAVILESHRNWVDNSPIKSLQLSAEYLKQHG